jgi:hypothetical protein
LENFKISKLNRLLNTIFSIFRPLFWALTLKSF